MCDDSRITDLDKKLVIDCDSFSFPVVEWEEIGKAIQADHTDISEYECFADFWHDHQDRVREATFNTVDKFLDQKESKKSV